MLIHAPQARPAIHQLGASRIREVANAGIGIDDVLPFWFGEPDETTPDFIRAAATQALAQGDTFYTHNLGIAPLREAIATYVSSLHQPVAPDRIAVTSSGVTALMLLSQLVIEPGDRVVAVTPLWPNLVEIPKILGAEVITVPLDFGRDPAAPLWELDLDRLLDTLTPGTRAVLLNSPNNPTGWVITRAQQEAILAHCRKHGIWIMADDVYERLVYDDSRCAPSFLDIADERDLLVSANSFSKSWLMTGWRLGWLTVPQAVMADLGKLIEYNTSCAPSFVQRAAVVAVEQGEEVIARTVARYRATRDFLHARLSAMPGISVPLPLGSMYLFFRVEGAQDTLALCKDLVRHAHLGLAPGSAFGAEGEGYVRWCIASSIERMEDGVQRFERFFAAR